MMANSNGDVGQSVESLIPEPALLSNDTGEVDADRVTTDKVQVADNLKPSAYSNPEAATIETHTPSSTHRGDMYVSIDPKTVPGKDATPVVMNPAALPVIEIDKAPLPTAPPVM